MVRWMCNVKVKDRVLSKELLLRDIVRPTLLEDVLRSIEKLSMVNTAQKYTKPHIFKRKIHFGEGNSHSIAPFVRPLFGLAVTAGLL